MTYRIFCLLFLVAVSFLIRLQYCLIQEISQCLARWFNAAIRRMNHSPTSGTRKMAAPIASIRHISEIGSIPNAQLIIAVPMKTLPRRRRTPDVTHCHEADPLCKRQHSDNRQQENLYNKFYRKKCDLEECSHDFCLSFLFG